MNGEDLNRRYHELKGWKIKKASSGNGIKWFYLVRPDKSVCGNSMPDHLAWAGLPPLHLDANLAIAEADKLGGHISIATVEDDADCPVKGRHWNVMLESGEFQNWPDVCAVSLCEAILKALIAKEEGK